MPRSTIATADRIRDFSSAQGDKLDISNYSAASFIGSAAFSNSAGEVRAQLIGGNTYVMGDQNGDGVADEYLTAARGWNVSGSYHGYAYGPKRDGLGNLWVALNLDMGERADRADDQPELGQVLSVMDALRSTRAGEEPLAICTLKGFGPIEQGPLELADAIAQHALTQRDFLRWVAALPLQRLVRCRCISCTAARNQRWACSFSLPVSWRNSGCNT